MRRWSQRRQSVVVSRQTAVDDADVLMTDCRLTDCDYRLSLRLMTDESVDVAIVGAGVSGLAAAYELRKRKRSVVVLERERAAGRHHS